MPDVVKSNLGPVTAYADAVKHGYTGSREDFGNLLAGAGKNLTDATAAKDAAQKAATDAAGYKQSAADSLQGAQTAQSAAEKAVEDASAAKNAAETAKAGAEAAQTAAGEQATAAAASATAAENSEAAAKKAAQDASDVKDSIPEDYSQMSAAVSQLKEATAKLKDGKISKFYASSQGNTNLPDSDDGRIMDLKLYGKSEQTQYSGKNLLKNINWETQTVSGVTIEKTSDTVFKISGTATGDVEFNSSWGQNIEVPAQSYLLCKILHGSCPVGSKVTFFTSSYDAIASEIGGVSNLRTSAITCGLVRFAIKKGSNINCTVGLSLQMDTSTAYEPYVGGIPSPNPEYPQEIKSVVRPSIKVTGKNLFNPVNVADASGLYRTNACTYSYQNGVFVISATGNDAYIGGFANVEEYIDNLYIAIPVNSQKKYRVTLYGAFDKIVGGYADADKKVLATYFDVNDLNTATLKANAKYLFIRPGINASRAGETYTGWIQVEEGSTATAYEPYTEQTVTLPYTLNAIPVTSGGNVTIDGQQYIADYVDVERGKLVTLIQAYKPTTCTEKDSGTNELFQFGKGMYEHSRFGLCNMLPITDGAENAVKMPAAFYFTGDYNLWCKIPQLTADSTVDDATAWAKQYKPVFYGVLATPTETDLTADEIAAFKALVSHYPVTNVSTTSDQLDGYTVFDYPISLANGWNYVKQQLGDTRDYLYGIDLMTAEAYVNSEYAAALAEIEV